MTAATGLRFSIVIPTFDRPGQLGECLQALTELDYPRDRFEVVVVDDGSPTDLGPVVDAVADCLDLRLIRQSNSGAGAARNSGAREARGRYLVFTDDDCLPPPHWLRHLCAQFERYPDAMIGGPAVNLLADDPWARASHLVLAMVYLHFNRRRDEGRFVSSNNMALPAAGFAAVGGFDKHYRWPAAGAEDRDLCDRWRCRGGRIVFVVEAQIGHCHRLSFQDFCRQYFAYGRGAWIFHRHRTFGRSKSLWGDVGLHLELHRLVGHVLSGVPLTECLAMLPRLGLWQLTNATGFAYQAMQDLGRTSSAPSSAR